MRLARALVAGQRRDRARLVEPNPRVELPRQDRLAVVAPALGFGAIDHPDEALEPRLHQFRAQLRIKRTFAQVEHETPDAGLVALALVTFGKRRIDTFDLHRLVPVVRGSHRPAVRAKSDQPGRIAEFLLGELADV